LKDESANNFGTIKDRRNRKVVEEANRLKVDKLVLITSGNNGYSLCRSAEGTHIKIVCIINKDLPESLKVLLKSVAYQVIEVNLNHKILRPEELVAFARETEDEVIWDVTNGFEDHYASVVSEVIENVIPDYLVVPLGSGGVFVGIAQEIERLNLGTKVVGMGVQNSINSIADKLSTPWTPYAKAVEAYQNFGHKVFRLTEDQVRKTYKHYQNLTSCEYSSAVVFSAPEKIKFKKGDKVVFLNTGKIRI
jgi:cysteine synthase